MTEMLVSCPFCTGRPSMITAPPPPPPLSGTKLEANGARTAGSASTRRTMSSTRRSLASGSLVSRARHVEPHRHQRLGIEPDIEAAKIQERPHEQQRADERHERKGDLRDDERASQERLRDAVAARPFLQRLVQVAARDLQRRKQSEDIAVPAATAIV